MKRSLLLLIMIISALIVKSSYGVMVDRILATVGDDIITFGDYQKFIKSNGDIGSKDAVDQKLLRDLVEERVVLCEARKRGMEASDADIDRMIEEFRNQNGMSSEDLDRTLKDEGFSMKSYRKSMADRILFLKLVGSEVDSKIIVTDKEIEDFYLQNKKDYIASPEKIEIKAIFLKLNDGITVTELTDLKRRAMKISALLKDGYNFGSLVEEYSDEPLKSQGGILGTFQRGTLIPPLDMKAFSMKKGEISDPIWVTEGVYILQITNRTDESFKTIGEVKEDIHNNLYKQKRERFFNEWIKALWERSSVTINQS